METKIDLYIEYSSLPFRINFNKMLSDDYRKTVQVLLYYLLVQKGSDPLYPELGIDFSVFNKDKIVIRNEFEILAYNLNSYGYNVRFVDAVVENGTVKAIWEINGELATIRFNIGNTEIIE